MTEASFRWYLPYQAPMALAGFAWFARDGLYCRLPRNFPKAFREPVDALAFNTAGGQVRFQTDALQIALRAQLAGAHGMYHMPATGQCGFDCYVGEPFAQRYCGTARFDGIQAEYESVVMTAPDRHMRNITINFPLYQGVETVWVGLPDDARLLPPPPWVDDRPVIVYGTSITQGGCASRPGMAWTNILSRRANRPFINLGFSGSGKGDPEVAEAMAEIPNPAAFVLDYESNAGYEGIIATLEPFIALLRVAHPSTPILIVSRIRYARDLLDPTNERLRAAAREFQRDLVEQIRDTGDPHLFFFDGGDLLGDDFDECTVDGVHPTDLGFSRMAHALYPVLNTVLSSLPVSG